MNPAERIEAIKEIAGAMADWKFDEVALVLGQFEMPVGPYSIGDDMQQYVTSMVESSASDRLEGLSDYVQSPGVGDRRGSAETARGPWEKVGFLHLFISHVHTVKGTVSEISRELLDYGIEGFVAHVDIKPSQEWLSTIEAGLRTSDAAVAYMTENFPSSQWTDQEMGFVFAQDKLIVPIEAGQLPYGFVSRYQAITGASGKSPAEIAQLIFNVLVAHERTAEQMSDALIAALVQSTSFRTSIDVSKRINNHVTNWNADRLQAIEQARNENDQVYIPVGVADRIDAILERHRS